MTERRIRELPENLNTLGWDGTSTCAWGTFVRDGWPHTLKIEMWLSPAFTSPFNSLYLSVFN